MIYNMEDLLDFMQEVASIGDIIKGVAGILSISAIYMAITDWLPKLSIGSFVVRKKYYNVQNVTNIVSAQFYEGGTVPDNVRKEIILLTSPKVRNVMKNKEIKLEK